MKGNCRKKNLTTCERKISWYKAALRYIWNQLSRIIKTCTPRYLYGKYSQLLIYWIQPILFKNNCNYWAEETYLQPSRKPTIEFSCKNNGFRPLIIHTKELLRRCLTMLYSKYASSVAVIVILLHRNVFGILVF